MPQSCFAFLIQDSVRLFVSLVFVPELWRAKQTQTDFDFPEEATSLIQKGSQSEASFNPHLQLEPVCDSAALIEAATTNFYMFLHSRFLDQCLAIEQNLDMPPHDGGADAVFPTPMEEIRFENHLLNIPVLSMGPLLPELTPPTRSSANS